MRTRQEEFDIVVKHLETQKQRSSKGNGCLYRGPNGTKCAVGILIPDNVKLTLGQNGTDVRGLRQEIKLSFSLSNLELENLQHIHDGEAHWDEDGLNQTGKNRLRAFAIESKLDYKGTA